MEHWLPLFEEKLVTLFDHLGEDAVYVRDSGVAGAADARFEAIRDYYANRKQAGSADPGSYRPVEPAQLYLNAEEWDARIGSHAAHLTTPFHEPESEQVVDFGVRSEEHTSELQSLMRNSYAVFCLKTKKKKRRI